MFVILYVIICYKSDNEMNNYCCEGNCYFNYYEMDYNK